MKGFGCENVTVVWGILQITKAHISDNGTKQGVNSRRKSMSHQH